MNWTIIHLPEHTSHAHGNDIFIVEEDCHFLLAQSDSILSRGDPIVMLCPVGCI